MCYFRILPIHRHITFNLAGVDVHDLELELLIISPIPNGKNILLLDL